MVGFVPASAIEISSTRVLYNPAIVKSSLNAIVKEMKVRVLHFTLPNERKLIAAPYFSPSVVLKSFLPCTPPLSESKHKDFKLQEQTQVKSI